FRLYMSVEKIKTAAMLRKRKMAAAANEETDESNDEIQVVFETPAKPRVSRSMVANGRRLNEARNVSTLREQLEMARERELDDLKSDVNRLTEDRNEWMYKAGYERGKRDREYNSFTEDYNRLWIERDEWRDKYETSQSKLLEQQRKFEDYVKQPCSSMAPSKSRSSSPAPCTPGPNTVSD
ncbi:hypothetical protein PFISCL1PPCAC_6701, partial [Pristionchus fissidentatus]